MLRYRYNPSFESIYAIVPSVPAILLIMFPSTLAALIRERERGTLEHLLVMPLTSFEIAIAKVWANGLVMLVAVALCLVFVVQGLLSIPVAGSMARVRACGRPWPGLLHRQPRPVSALDGQEHLMACRARGTGWVYSTPPQLTLAHHVASLQLAFQGSAVCAHSGRAHALGAVIKQPLARLKILVLPVPGVKRLIL